jgi:hypothetical protein
MRPRVALVLAALVVAIGSRPARAAEPSAAAPAGPVVSICALGSDAEWLATELARSTPANATVVERKLASRGQRAAIDLDDPQKHGPLVRAVENVAKSAGVDVSVLAQVRRTRTHRSVHVLVVPTNDPTRVVEREIALGKARDPAGDAIAVHDVVVPLLTGVANPPVAHAAEPPAATTAPARAVASAVDVRPGVPTKDAPAAGPAPSSAGIDHALFVVSAEGGALTRHFDYVDKLTPELRSYNLSVAPMAVIGGEIYPLGHASSNVIDFGLVGSYGRSFFAQSAASSGPKLDTTWSQFDAGICARLRTGQHGPVFAARVGYGGAAFSFSDPGPLADGLPDVSYRFVRAGLDARVPFGRFAVNAGADYLYIVSAGMVADRFPRASVGGVSAQLGAAFEIVPGLEARAGARYERFFYALSPVPGDRDVAGGALDEMAYATLGLAYYR